MLGDVFTRLGHLIARRPGIVVLVWVLLTGAGYAIAVAGVHGESLFDRVTTGAPSEPGSESARAQDLLTERFAAGQTITLMVQDVDPSDPAIAATMATVNEDLAAIEGAEPPANPYAFGDGLADPDAPAFLAASGDGFLVTVGLAPGLDDATHDKALTRVTNTLEALPGRLSDVAPGAGDATGIVSSPDLIESEITGQVQEDLTTGETISLPIALVVMVLVFGGFLAAAMPMAGALASIGAGLGTLWGVTHLMAVDASVVNVITLLGLGLSIDYGLLIVSRFREELHAGIEEEAERRRRWKLARKEAVKGRGGKRKGKRGGQRSVAPVTAELPPPPVPVGTRALVATMRTAGRTVVFSALTVAISISGLMVFRPEIMRSVGVGGLTAVLIAVATAVTLVPALLALTGTRLAGPSVLARVPGLGRVLSRTADVQSDDGALARLAVRVQRRPWWVAGACVVVLGILAFPVLHLQMRNSGVELLPASSTQREFVDEFVAGYPMAQPADVTVVARAPAADAEAWTRDLADVADVTRASVTAVADPYVRIGVHLDVEDGAGARAVAVVEGIRDMEPGFDFWVTGQAAAQIDFVDALAERVWWAVGIVVVATFVLLFLMTGSIVIPIKALVTNAISLSASLGILVWVFQDGHLEGLLGFESVGGIETYVVAMVIAFAFGLAMDYEVFLLARVKELYDSGLPNDKAVEVGLQRSGRIITSAATIIVMVFAGFVFGELLVIKEVGFALAIAIVIDATLVRLLLVPATMTLLGKHNWWAPRPLRALYARVGISH